MAIMAGCMSQMWLFGPDLRHAVRTVWRRGNARTAIVVLSLGVGVSTAMLSLSMPFLLMDLPFERASELVVVTEVDENGGSRPPTGSQLERLAGRHDIFAAVAGWEEGLPVRVRADGESLVFRPGYVTESWFHVLGLPAPSGDWSGRGSETEAPAVLLPNASASFENVAAQQPSFPRQDKGSIRIVGLLPRNFVFPTERSGSRDVLLPAPASRAGSARFLGVIGRLANRRTASSAGQLMSVDGVTYRLWSLRHAMVARFRALAAGAALAGFLLLLGCAANAANLMFVQAVYRRGEIALRAALGASSLDLTRLVAAELVLIAGCSWGAGLLIAMGILECCTALMPSEYVSLGSPRVDLRAVLFSAGVLVAMLAASAAPALSTVLMTGVQRGRRSRLIGQGGALGVARHVLAGVQFAITMIFLTGAALLIRSYATLMSVDTGFSASTTILSASYPPSRPREAHGADVRRTLEDIRLLPGVGAAGASIGTLMDEMDIVSFLRVAGRTPDRDILVKHVSAGYFQAMGTELLAGRDFTPDDGQQAAVMIVNQMLAQKYWAGDVPLGDTAFVGARPKRIVGVVQTTRDVALDAAPRPTIFLPLIDPHPAMPVHYSVRTSGGVNLSQIRAAMHRVQPDVVIVDESTVRSRLLGTVTDRSFATLILTLLATAGITISASGLFGIVAFMVARRTREMAIRVALGAPVRSVRILVLRDITVTATCGILVGTLVGWWASRSAEQLLYGVRGGDAATIAAAGVAMCAVAAVSAWAASVRSETTLMTALRIE